MARYCGFSGVARLSTMFRSTRKPDDHESSLLQLLIDIPGHAAVAGIAGRRRTVWVLRTDATVDDHFYLLDTRKAGREVLVEIWTVLGDYDEDPHVGSLPRASPVDVRFL